MSTDGLLDEATRLADSDWPPAALTIPVLRALVERVQKAETDAEMWRERVGLAAEEIRDTAKTLANVQFIHQGCELVRRKDVEAALTQRDAARGKLDQVRDWAHHIRTTRQRGDLEYNAACDVLAILDGKTGD